MWYPRPAQMTPSQTRAVVAILWSYQLENVVSILVVLEWRTKGEVRTMTTTDVRVRRVKTRIPSREALFDLWSRDKVYSGVCVPPSPKTSIRRILPGLTSMLLVTGSPRPIKLTLPSYEIKPLPRRIYRRKSYLFSCTPPLPREKKKRNTRIQWAHWSTIVWGIVKLAGTRDAKYHFFLNIMWIENQASTFQAIH